MNRRVYLFFVLAMCSSLLIGCGGGSSSDASLTPIVSGTTTSPGSAEGTPSSAPAIVVGSPSALSLQSGNNQTGIVATELATPLAVVVTDGNGLPVSGQTVTFKVTSGGGSVFAGTATTDGAGIARERWKLGTSAGNQQLEARLVGSDGSALVSVFNAAGTPAEPTRIEKISGDGQSTIQLQSLSSQLQVRVLDSFGNATPNSSAVFIIVSGGGSISSPSSVTDSAGNASTNWTLGSQLGTQRLMVSIANGASVVFSASALRAAPSAPTALVKFSGDGVNSLQHVALSQPVVIKAVDRLANGVPGATVNFSADTGIGNIVSASIVTDADGLANWNVDFHEVGQKTIVVSLTGIPSVSFAINVGANGQRFDGLYTLTLTYSGSAPQTETVKLVNGQWGDGPPRFLWTGSTSASTGATQISHDLHVDDDQLTGTLTLGSTGVATGSGTMKSRTQVDGTFRTGVWSAVRR